MSNPTIVLCPHRQNPKACLQCFHQRGQAPQPTPMHPEGGQRRNPHTGELAFDAPPQVQRGVDRALRGFTPYMPDASAAPQGEQAVVPTAETSGKVAVVDGAQAQASKKQQAVPAGEAQPARQPYAAPRAEPGQEFDERGNEKLWQPAPQVERELNLIDKLPQHPDAVRGRR